MAQYSICSKRSAIRAQAISCIRRWLVSRVCELLRLSDVSVICRVTDLQFPIQSAIRPYIGNRAAPALWRTLGFNTQISDVAENLDRYISCLERTA